MHVSPGIKEKYRAGMIGAVYSALWDDEHPMAVFAISRTRRAANVLAVTDQRVLTFQRIGRLRYALVDSIDGAEIADGYVVMTGPQRGNASAFIAMDEMFLGTALRVSDAELHYIRGLLRWITGAQPFEPRVGLYDLAARAADAARWNAEHGASEVSGTQTAVLTAPAPSTNGHDDALARRVSDEIAELARLHASGALSADEFTAAKAALIAKI